MDSKDDCQLLYTAQKAWGATGNTHNGRADWADQYGSRLLDHIAALDARIDALEGALQDMLALLEDAPELNPSNYDHDQVCLLNNQMIQAWQLAHSMHSGESAIRSAI